jgi:hypothetical protein
MTILPHLLLRAHLRILGLIYGTMKLLDMHLGSALAVSLLAAAAPLFPAPVAVLNLDRNVFNGLYPLART